MRDVRLGIGSFTFPWAAGVAGHPPPRVLTPLDLLDRAVELGVKVVQICDNMPLHRLSAGAVRRLGDAAADRGIEIEVGTRGSGRAHLRGYLDLARRLKSRILRVVVDAKGDEPPREEIAGRLAGVMPEARKAGIVLAIENHDRLPAADFAWIVRAVGGPNIGICLDTVNSFGALEGPEAVVGVLAPLTVNLHLKDFTVTRTASQLGFSISGAPAGAGRLDVPWLLARLRAAGRDPNAIVELWPPFTGDLAATIRLEEDWARASVAFLRNQGHV